jgi:hypothetical protein
MRERIWLAAALMPLFSAVLLYLCWHGVYDGTPATRLSSKLHTERIMQVVDEEHIGDAGGADSGCAQRAHGVREPL